MSVCVCVDAKLTHANNPLNVNTANIYLLGELVDGLIGVFIGERVYVDFHSCHRGEMGEGNGGSGGGEVQGTVRNKSCITAAYVM